MDEVFEDYFEELESCCLCEWRCSINRLKGEKGVCKLGKPEIASTQLHPAPPQSYTVFFVGCNYKCLGCQNYQIAHFPDQNRVSHWFMDPKFVAEDAIMMINSPFGRSIRADRIFFSGGEATCSLPYAEKIVEEARKIDPKMKVNFDTNGFLTEESLGRVLRFSDSITYDIKAYHDDVHRALTGAPVEPVLRNAEVIGMEAKDKLWEFRVLVIPGLNEGEIKPICDFIAGIDPSLPVNFLAFRPNFVLDHHHGASRDLMKKAVKIGKMAGLEYVDWCGSSGIEGLDYVIEKVNVYGREEARIGGGFAFLAGCKTHPRDCGRCKNNQSCSLKGYQPVRRT
ncbi:MAG: radical SAM protein [Candidatus Hodarchaeota archaeon]